MIRANCVVGVGTLKATISCTQTCPTQPMDGQPAQCRVVSATPRGVLTKKAALLWNKLVPNTINEKPTDPATAKVARVLMRIPIHKLRIAWSAAWGLLAVLLAGFWVRSSHVADGAYIPLPAQSAISIRSITSRLVVTHHATGRTRTWAAWSGDFDDFQLVEARLADDSFGFGYFANSPNRTVIVPHWFVIAICTTLAALPTIRWSTRFRLRTLLIITTLFAVALGGILYVERR